MDSKAVCSEFKSRLAHQRDSRKAVSFFVSIASLKVSVKPNSVSVKPNSV